MRRGNIRLARGYCSVGRRDCRSVGVLYETDPIPGVDPSLEQIPGGGGRGGGGAPATNPQGVDPCTDPNQGHLEPNLWHILCDPVGLGSNLSIVPTGNGGGIDVGVFLKPSVTPTQQLTTVILKSAQGMNAPIAL